MLELVVFENCMTVFVLIFTLLYSEALKKKKEDEKKKKEGAKRNAEPVKEDPLEPEKLLKEAQEKALEKAKEWCEWLETLR